MCPEALALTAQNLANYLIDRGWMKRTDEVFIQELGGGVSNVVLLAEWKGNSDRRWVVKQSLAKLRVEADWRSEQERIFREAEAINMLRDTLGAFSLPEIIDVDQNSYAYIMTAAPVGSEPWKSLLLRGEVETEIARKTGDLLAKLIIAGRLVPALQDRFEDRTVFDQLRIDPYYRTTANHHRELRAAFDALIADSWKIRTSIVHGDYSPKNILVKDRNICLIDFEVVHWGDPSFDAAFLLNHLFLKACHQPRYSGLYFQAAQAFWRALLDGAAGECGEQFERMAMRHLGALLLARIDGKSPVEYIRDDQTKQQVRGLARQILLEPAERFEQAIAIVERQCAASRML